jgi:ABC-type multidrug transport system ATPase subunit
MYAVSEPHSAVDVALERVGLAARADDRAATLSRGLLQRLNLARAIVHQPVVLILDEPDTGLDSAGRELLSSIVGEWTQRGASVILTSHNLDFALGAATRAVLLAHGRVLVERASADLTPFEAAALIADQFSGVR